MTIIPEVHRALRDSVAAAAPRRRRRRLRVGAPAALLLALAAGGSALAATGAWRPVLGSDQGQPVQRAPRPLAAPLRAELAVLGRPQTDRDRTLPVERILRSLHGASRPHVEDIRLLATHRGGVAALVPLERENYRTAGGPRRDRLCLFYSRQISADAPEIASSVCGTNSDLLAGRITNWLPANQVAGDTTVISGLDRTHQWGLVPDGVARVVVTFYGGDTATADVRDNYYDASVAQPDYPAKAGVPKDTRWFDAAGAIVERPGSRR